MTKMHTPAVPTTLALTLLLTVTAATPCAAAVTRVFGDGFDITGGVGGVSANNSYLGEQTSISLAASAKLGSLTASSRTDVIGPGGIQQGGGGASAAFEDIVTLNHPALAGQPGTANARIRYSLRAERVIITGSGTHYDDASAAFSLTIASGGATDTVSVRGETNGVVANIVESDVRSLVEILVPFEFVYGQPFVLSASVNAGSLWVVDGGLYDGAFNSASLPDGLDWLGMSDLPAGTTVDAAVDWSKPYTEFVVPEPSTLAVPVLLGLLASRRRR